MVSLSFDKLRRSGPLMVSPSNDKLRVSGVSAACSGGLATGLPRPLSLTLSHEGGGDYSLPLDGGGLGRG